MAQVHQLPPHQIKIQQTNKKIIKNSQEEVLVEFFIVLLAITN